MNEGGIGGIGRVHRIRGGKGLEVNEVISRYVVEGGKLNNSDNHNYSDNHNSEDVEDDNVKSEKH